MPSHSRKSSRRRRSRYNIHMSNTIKDLQKSHPKMSHKSAF